MVTRNVNTYRRLFQPVHKNLFGRVNETSETVDRSAKLLSDCGIVKSTSNGIFALLPLGLRSLNKLTGIVDYEMENIGAQKLLLPALTPSHLWKKTMRYENNQSELFLLRDRHDKEYILSPTHEETITHLIASLGLMSPKELPLKLYQVSSKWRDEMRPQSGFLRSREFIMKDLYIFDETEEAAHHSYNLVSEAYDKIFAKIGLPVIKCVGDAAPMGGSTSHEYHYTTNIGEDHVLVCRDCNYSVNKAVTNKTTCPNCNKDLTENVTAEVGHTFLLNTKYSQPLGAKYTRNNETLPLVMGSYGLGLSRIFAVALQILSTENNIRWPKPIVPYTVCIIIPKAGSKEEDAAKYLDTIIEILCQLNIDVIIDDRSDQTIGRRFRSADVTGYPYVIVIGKAATESTPLFEIHDMYNSKSQNLSLEALTDYLKSINGESEDAYKYAVKC